MNTQIKESLSPQHRLGYLDMIKAFAIFMVFVGHRTDNTLLESYIYSFHMPLFFWLSGFLYNPAKYRHFRTFIYRRFRTLLIPYFLFAIGSFIFWLVVLRSLSVRGQVFAINPWFPFFGVFYGVGEGKWCNPLDVALWFLPCLFMTDLIFWHIHTFFRGKARLCVIFACAITGYATSLWLPFRLPWSFDVAFTAVVFYFAGNMARRARDPIDTLSKGGNIVVFASLAVLGGFLSFLNGKADMNYNYFGNPILFYGAAFASIYFWYHLIRLVPPVSAFTYIGQNTIVLVGLAGVSSFVLRGFHYILSGNLPTAEKSGSIEAMVYSVLSIGLLVPVMYLLNRFAPSILGRKPRDAGHGAECAGD